MKKTIIILFFTIILFFIFNIIEGISLLALETNIGNGDYPLFLLFFFPIIKLIILYFSLKRIFLSIYEEKQLFFKLSMSSLLVIIFDKILFYLLQTTLYEYFPNFDPRKDALESLNVEYTAPKFAILNDIFIHPFIQTYYYILDFKNSFINVILELINFGLLISILIPLLILFQYSKKRKEKLY